MSLACDSSACKVEELKECARWTRALAGNVGDGAGAYGAACLLIGRHGSSA